MGFREEVLGSLSCRVRRTEKPQLAVVLGFSKHPEVTINSTTTLWNLKEVASSEITSRGWAFEA